MNNGRKKVVFKDDKKTKVAIGNVDFVDEFIKVTNSKKQEILINRNYIVFIKDVDMKD